MWNELSWYFRATDEETKKIWDAGILTLDANVLLDLYSPRHLSYCWETSTRTQSGAESIRRPSITMQWLNACVGSA